MRFHNAAKPVLLLEKLIGNSTEEGELVLDPFVGSGSTILACEELERRCLAVDVEPDAVEIAIGRWEQLTGKKAKRERSSRRKSR